MAKRFLELLLFLSLLLITLGLQPLNADSPALEQLRTHISSLQQVLSDPNLAGPQHSAHRRKLARVILLQLFAFDEMSSRSLGANARRYKNRLAEFTPLFVDFLEHAYMGTLEENGDAKILYMREILEGDNSEIETKTTLRNGDQYRVGYKLYRSPAGWRVYDVSVDGISLVNNYRSQFDRVLSRKSFDGLLQDLREKKETFD
jgi:phospholipid transport system substrate-binding protein